MQFNENQNNAALIEASSDAFRHPEWDELERASTKVILRWAWETLGTGVFVSSSFQTQSVPLLHIVSQVCPQMTVLFLDTGYHFPETLAFRDELQKAFGLKIRTIRPISAGSQSDIAQESPLYSVNPDLCCHLNKVKPMRMALEDALGWISGVRRDQTSRRAELKVVEAEPSGILKIHPMLHWRREEIWDYIKNHNLPKHPLHGQGYRSIGCAPCTRPAGQGEDDRDGRWPGREKTECGLHTQRAPLAS
ncbi:MAG: phosphoadenylyl-sulfate reductase [Candidatus Omnitrophota bacterium]